MANRVNVDIDASIRGLDASIERALRPLRNFLNEANARTGGNQNVQLNPAGVRYLTQQLRQQGGTAVDESQLQNFEQRLMRVVQLQEQAADAWRTQDSAGYLRSLESITQEMSGASEGLRDMFSTVEADIETNVRQLQRHQRNWDGIAQKVRASRRRNFDGDVRTRFDALDKTLTDVQQNPPMLQLLSAQGITPENLSRFQQQWRSLRYTQSGSRAKVLNAGAAQKILSDNARVLDAMGQAEVAMGQRLEALRTLSEGVDVSELEQAASAAPGAVARQGDKADLSFSRERASMRRREQAFGVLFNQDAGANPEAFSQFTRFFAPTIEAFNNELRNIFSNVLGGLGAAAVFLTIQSIAQTTQDISELTHNLEVYERLLDGDSEREKAKKVRELRSEINEFAASAGLAVGELSSLLNQLERRDISTDGVSELLARAQLSAETFGLDGQQLLEGSLEQFQAMQTSNVDAGVYSNLIATAGKNAPEALEAFNELITLSSSLTFSYQELAAAAIYYARTGYEVRDSQTQIESAVKGGLDSVREADEELRNYAENRDLLTVLFGEPDDVSRMQRELSAQIVKAWRGLLENMGFGTDNRAFATVQSMLLGILKTLETITGLVAQLGNVPGANMVSRFVQAALTIGAMTTGLRLAGTLMRFLLMQLGDVRKAMVGVQGAIAAMGTAQIATDFAAASTTSGTFFTRAQAGFQKLITQGKSFRGILTMIASLFKGAIPLMIVGGAVALGSFIVSQAQARRAEAVNLGSDGQPLPGGEDIGAEVEAVQQALAGLTRGQRIQALTGDFNGLDAIPNIDEIKETLSGGSLQARIEVLRQYERDWQAAVAQRLEAMHDTAEELKEQHPHFERVIDAVLQVQDSLPEDETDMLNAIGKIFDDSGFLQDLNVLPTASALVRVIIALRNAQKELAEATEPLAELDNVTDDGAEDEAVAVKRLEELKKLIESQKNLGLALYDLGETSSFSRRFEQDIGQARAVINMLEQMRAGADDETLRELNENIAEQYGIIVEANVARARELYAQQSDNIATMSESTERHLLGLEAALQLLEGLRAAQGGAADAETQAKLADDIQRQENDVVEAKRALNAYVAGLGDAQRSVTRGVLDALDSGADILNDSNRALTRVFEAAQQELESLQDAPFEERRVRMDALEQALNQALPAALESDKNRRLIDGALRGLEARESTAQRLEGVRGLLREFAGSVSDDDTNYLLSRLNDTFFADGGLLNTLRESQDVFRDSVNAFVEGGQPTRGPGGELSDELRGNIRAFGELEREAQAALSAQDEYAYELSVQFQGRRSEAGRTVETLEIEQAELQQSIRELERLPDSRENATALAYKRDELNDVTKRLEDARLSYRVLGEQMLEWQARLKSERQQIVGEIQSLTGDYLRFLEDLNRALPGYLEQLTGELDAIRENALSRIESVGLREESLAAAVEKGREELEAGLSESTATLLQEAENLEEAAQLLEDEVNAMPPSDDWTLALELIERVRTMRTEAEALRAFVGTLNEAADDANVALDAQEDKGAIDRLTQEMSRTQTRLSRVDILSDEAEALRGTFREQQATLESLTSAFAATYGEALPDTVQALLDSSEDNAHALKAMEEAAVRTGIDRELSAAQNDITAAAEVLNGNPLYKRALSGDAEDVLFGGLRRMVAAVGKAQASGLYDAEQLFGLLQQQLGGLETAGSAIASTLGSGALRNPAELLTQLESRGFSSDEALFLVENVLYSQLEGYARAFLEEGQRSLAGIDTENPEEFENRLGTNRANLRNFRSYLEGLRDALGDEVADKVEAALSEDAIDYAEAVYRAEDDFYTGLVEGLLSRAQTPEEIAQAIVQASEYAPRVRPEAQGRIKESIDEATEELQSALSELLSETVSQAMPENVEAFVAQYVGALPEDVQAELAEALSGDFSERQLDFSRRLAENARGQYEQLAESFRYRAEDNPEVALEELGSVTTQLLGAYAVQFRVLKEAISQAEDDIEREALTQELGGLFQEFVADMERLGVDTAGFAEALAGQVDSNTLRTSLGSLEQLMAGIPALVLPDVEELADMLDESPETLMALLAAMFGKVLEATDKAQREIEGLSVDEVNLRNLLDSSMDDAELQLSEQAAGLNTAAYGSTQERAAFAGQAASFVDSLVGEILSRQQQRFEGTPDGERRALVATEASINQLLEDGVPGLEITAEQYEYVVAALRRERNALAENTLSLKTAFQSFVEGLVNALAGSLSQLIVDFANIPIRMFEEGRENQRRGDELAFDARVEERRIGDYERLRDEAIETYGAASEKVAEYNEKLIEARARHLELADAMERNKDEAKGLFDFLLESIGNFVDSFIQAVQKLAADRLVMWLLNTLFPSGPGNVSDINIRTNGTGTPVGGSTTAPGLSPGNSFAQPASVRFENDEAAIMEREPSAAAQGGSPLQTGVGLGMNVASGAASSALMGAGASAFAASAAVAAGALAVGALVSYAMRLYDEYSDLEQSHIKEGRNRFTENPDIFSPVDTDVRRGRQVTVRIEGELNRQRLAREAQRQVYDSIDKELLD